jgi:hypothetical protein
MEPTIGGKSGESSGCGVTAAGAAAALAPVSFGPASATGAAASTRITAVEARR